MHQITAIWKNHKNNPVLVEGERAQGEKVEQQQRRR
jgi:hypothetical protein